MIHTYLTGSGHKIIPLDNNYIQPGMEMKNVVAPTNTSTHASDIYVHVYRQRLGGDMGLEKV